jgi:LPS-assembly protein
MRARKFILPCLFPLFLLWFALAATGSHAQEAPTQDRPTLLSADEVTYDENLEIVTARGNVEIAQDDRVLIADVVSYNIRTGVVTATGNITLVEPTGELVFADYVELSDDLRDGFIREIRILMTDQSRIAAAGGIRREGNITLFKRGVFSPCKLCRDEPGRPPLWQIRAAEVEHNQQTQTIQYRDAWMEIFGIPVFYTPYFEHPDPTVDRKSGFLAPSFGSTGTLGFTTQIPYFWAISPDKDATFEPIITTKQSVVLAGEYRQAFPNGTFDFSGSGTFADLEDEDGTIDKDQFRGHIDSTGRFEIDETWRWGFDARRTTDDTYLRLYNFSADRTLTSRAFVEALNGRNYAAANAMIYQGLREEDDNDEAPIIAPLLEFDYVGEPGWAGGKFTADASLLALTRIEGRDSRRLAVVGAYELPYTGPLGDVYTVTASLQTDGYWTHGVDPQSDDVNPVDPQGEDFAGRVFPQLTVRWEYPWVQSNGTLQQVVQPIGQAVFAPNGSNPGEIPNEDSLAFEFDDTNLFSRNRFAGEDRVDSGSRFDYGLEWTATYGEDGTANSLIGQSYRLSRSQDIFRDGSGLEDNLSDIVGRVEVNPIPELDFLYRFRLDNEDFKARRHEVSTVIGPPALNLDLSYVFISDEASAEEFDDREEIEMSLGSRLSENWSIFGSHRRDMEDNRTLSTSIGLTYEDECFLIEGIASRTFFDDRELDPEDAIFIRLVFKLLGEFSTS